MNKDRDIPRNGDIWVYFEGGEYMIIDIAKDVDYNFYQAILDYEKEHRKELLTKIIDQVKPEDLKAAGITLTKEQKKNMKENKKQRR